MRLRAVDFPAWLLLLSAGLMAARWVGGRTTAMAPLGRGLARFEAIVYINLDERKDRNEHILQQLQQVGAPMERVIRLSAVKERVGMLGCIESHIKAVDLAIANGWRNMLVLEDDVHFKLDAAAMAQRIENFFGTAVRQGLYWEVLLFAGGNFRKHQHSAIVRGEDGQELNVRRVYSAETTSAYALQQGYFSTLRRNFVESKSLCAIDCRRRRAGIDQHWKQLQARDNWLIFYPTLVEQNGSYSNIENTFIPAGYRDS